jgi:hypothetical protein
MTIAYELNHLIRAIAEDADRRLEVMFQDGEIEAVQGSYASVRLGANDQGTPGFFIPPRLSVLLGDHVLCYRRAGYQLVVEVLNRNASTGPDQPNSVEGAAEYLARQKLDRDTFYRLQLGLDTLDRPQILAGGGDDAADAEIVRSDIGEWTISDVLAVGGSSSSALRMLLDRAWRLEQRTGTSGDSAALQLRPELADKSTHLVTSDGTIIATFRDAGTLPQLSFFGATPIGRPVVTGSRAANAALASLISALAAYGLVTDATS